VDLQCFSRPGFGLDPTGWPDLERLAAFDGSSVFDLLALPRFRLAEGAVSASKAPFRAELDRPAFGTEILPGLSGKVSVVIESMNGRTTGRRANNVALLFFLPVSRLTQQVNRFSCLRYS
jgi:hypothetical protein